MVGVYSDKSEHSAVLAYHCLYALQHRGQEGSGISVSDGSCIRTHKGKGLVSDIFNDEKISSLKGSIAVGSNKYSTLKDMGEFLPLVGNLCFGQLSMSFSGALFCQEARKKMVDSGEIFTTNSDAEYLMHVIARKCSAMSVEEAIVNACKEVKGSYAIILMTKDKLIAVRDPYGIQSLIIGRTSDGSFVIVSETAALDLLCAEYIRDVEPGEVISISKDGLVICADFGVSKKSCVFEFVYTARPDSIINGKSVYEVREQCGRFLAERSGVDADIVIPVPDSGIAAALGYSHGSGISFDMGIVRNHYVGRTFIRPTQDIRNFAVKVKLNPIANLIKGKRVVVVDDSIVRGSTSKQIIVMLKEAGAREVHVRVASPLVLFPCYYGIDIPTKDSLIANHYDIEGIRKLIGADSLAFLELEDLKRAVGSDEYCCACFSGEYPVKCEC